MGGGNVHERPGAVCVTAAGGVTEPAALPSTATGSGSAVDIFDFTLSDGGAADTDNQTFILSLDGDAAPGSGTLSSTDAGGLTKNPSGGSVTWTDVRYDTNESIDLRGTSASFPASSGFEVYTTTVNVAADTDGTLTAGLGVTEPIALSSTAAFASAAVDIFDFTLTNGGAADGLPLSVTQIVLHTSGTGPFAKVAFRLSGPDAVNVLGVYNSGSNTLTFTSLSISIGSTTSETYTVNAYYTDSTELTEDQTLILSLNGDVDLTMATASNQMSGSNGAISNGSGSVVDIAATHLAFATEPPTSAVINNDFTGVVMVEALDAAGNLDTDFPEAITLAPVSASNNTIDVSGTLSSSDAGGLTKSANAGQASWVNLIHDTDQGIDLRATSATFENGSGDEAYSTKVDVQADSDGQVVAAAGVSEPISLPSSAGPGSPVDVFDFTLIDGGTADLATLEVFNIDLQTSGSVPFPNIQFWLNGPDAVNVPGTYTAGTNEVHFGLNISVPDGGSETYTVSVNFNPATGLSDGLSLTLTIASDSQINTGSGTMMSGSSPSLTTGATPVDVTADRLLMTGIPSSALANSDFAGDVVVEAVGIYGNVDTDFAEDITLSVASNPSGTLSSLDTGGTTQTASNGSATWADVRYNGAGSIQLYASSPSFVIGSGQHGSSSPITVSAASGGILIESLSIVEPTPLPSTARSMSVSVGVFDFTITDGGLEGLNLDVSEVIVHTAGDGPFGDVTFFLSGIGAPDVVGTYDAAANTLTFSSLLISVGDGQSHTFTVGAYYNVNPHALTGSAFQLSVNGDTDLTVSASGSQMSGSSTTVDNGSGALVDLTPTNAKIRDVFSVDLPSTVVSISDPAPTFQIVFEDEGGDGFPYLIEEMVFHTSGPLDKVTLLLDGPDESERFQFSGTKAASSSRTGVAGTYDAATSTLTYSGLTISVGDGSIETYSINAFFHDNIGLVDGETIELSFDTFVDITTPFSGSTGTAGHTVSLSSEILVDATELRFSTLPVGAQTGQVFATQPVVSAVDAAGNLDTDWSGEVSVSSSTGSLSGGSVTAVNGVATFSGVNVSTTFGATATLTASATGLLSATTNISIAGPAPPQPPPAQPPPPVVTNGPPRLSLLGAQFAAAGEPITVTLPVRDEDLGSVSVLITNRNTSLITDVIISGRTVSFVPAGGLFATSVSVQIQDKTGQLSDRRTMPLSWTNATPALSAVTDKKANVGDPIVLDLTGLGSDANDPVTALVWSVANTDPSLIAEVLIADGSITFVPVSGAVGTAG